MKSWLPWAMVVPLTSLVTLAGSHVYLSQREPPEPDANAIKQLQQENAQLKQTLQQLGGLVPGYRDCLFNVELLKNYVIDYEAYVQKNGLAVLAPRTKEEVDEFRAKFIAAQRQQYQ